MIKTHSFPATIEILEPAPLGSTIITLPGAKSSQSKHLSARFWTP